MWIEVKIIEYEWIKVFSYAYKSIDSKHDKYESYGQIHIHKYFCQAYFYCS